MKARHLTVVAALALSACGADSSSQVTSPTSSITTTSNGSTSSGGSTVTISRSRFENVELRVFAGTTVTFVNTDPFDHTVTSRDDSLVEFDSGAFGQDETFEFTFAEPGEYAYFCQIHPTMRAVVIVE